MPETEEKRYYFDVEGEIGSVPVDQRNAVKVKFPNASEVYKFEVKDGTVAYIPPDQWDNVKSKFPSAKRLGSPEVNTTSNWISAIGAPVRGMLNVTGSILQGLAAGSKFSQEEIIRYAMYASPLASKTAKEGYADYITKNDPTTDLAFKFGTYIKDWAEENIPTADLEAMGGWERFAVETVPNAAGSMFMFIAASLLGRGFGLSGALSAGATGAFSMGGSLFVDAKEAGASDEKAFIAFVAGMGLGMAEAIPIGRMFKKMDQWTGGTYKDIAIRSGIGGLEEFIQEGAQNFGENATAKSLFDFNRKLLEGVGEGGGAGFVLGLTMNAIGLSMRHRQYKKAGINDPKLRNEIEKNDRGLNKQAGVLLTPEDIKKRVLRETEENEKRINEQVEEQQAFSQTEETLFNETELKREQELGQEAEYLKSIGISDQEITLKQVEDLSSEVGEEFVFDSEQLKVANSEVESVLRAEGDPVAEKIIRDNELNNEGNEATITKIADDVESNINTEVKRDEVINPQEGQDIGFDEELLRRELGENYKEKIVAFEDIIANIVDPKANADILSEQLNNLSEKDAKEILTYVGIRQQDYSNRQDELTEEELVEYYTYTDAQSKLNNSLGNSNVPDYAQQEEPIDEESKSLSALESGDSDIAAAEADQERRGGNVPNFDKIIREFAATTQMSDADKRKEVNRITAKIQKFNKTDQARLNEYVKERNESAIEFGRVGENNEFSAAATIIPQAIEESFTGEPTQEELAAGSGLPAGSTEEQIATSQTGEVAQDVEQPVETKKTKKKPPKTVSPKEQHNAKEEAVAETEGDPDVEKWENSGQPLETANKIVNALIEQNIINRESSLEHAESIQTIAKQTETALQFAGHIQRKYPDLQSAESEIYSVYRTENELDEVQVFDVDIIKNFNLGVPEWEVTLEKSTFLNHKRKRLSNRFLVNKFLRRLGSDIMVFNIYESKQWGLKTKSKYKDAMPFNRRASIKSRDMRKEWWEDLEGLLNKRGYTLGPLSDSDTFVAFKIPEHMHDLPKSEIKIQAMSLFGEARANDFTAQGKMATIKEIVFHEAMTVLFPTWYNQNLPSNEVSKRFKLFLPKGEPLAYGSDIKIQIVPDIKLKDENGDIVFKKNDDPLEITDGNTLANPKFYFDFLDYNKLDRNSQHKTIITDDKDGQLVAIKHMTHVASPVEWKRITKQVGADPNIDLLVFDSAAKIANDSNGKDMKLPENRGKVFSLSPDSFRHLWTGAEHDDATFTRQIFNYTLNNAEVVDHVIQDIIKPIGQKVYKQYKDFRQQPDLLRRYIAEKMQDIPTHISDIRRYAQLGGILFKQIRTGLQRMLKSDLIDNQFIKLKRDGGFSYLKPDYDNIVKRGEIHIPYAQLNKIAAALKIDFDEKDADNVRREINKILQKKTLNVLTFRPPVNRIDNIQVLRITNILTEEDGNAVIMNTKDAILNKESDFDGDEVFYHYINSSNLQKLADHITKNSGQFEEIQVPKGITFRVGDINNRIATGVAAGLGKRAIGETAKAIMLKSVFVNNNLKIGRIKGTKKLYIIPRDADLKQFEKIWNIKKDLREWDEKIAQTSQAAVDNLKLNALEQGKSWQVLEGSIEYNLKDIYAQMFEGNIDKNQLASAIKDIKSAFDLFTRNFEADSTWDQEQINKKAREYIKLIEKTNALGNAPQEKMIIAMANMGYLARKPHAIVHDSANDNAHKIAVQDFKKQYIDNGIASSLSPALKASIEKEVKALFLEKKNFEASQPKDADESFYSQIYDEFAKRADERLEDAGRDYYDYLVFRGFKVTFDNEGKPHFGFPNSRFVLAVMSDRNIQRASALFNKQYEKYIRARSSQLNMGAWFKDKEEHNTQEERYDEALSNILVNVHDDLKSREESKQLEADMLKAGDDINKFMGKIGKMPFSEFLDFSGWKSLYNSLLAENGKTVADELTLKDKKTIAVGLEKLLGEMKRTGIGWTAKNFFFTSDLFRANLYTRKSGQELSKIQNEKDADHGKLLRPVKDIEELLDISKQEIGVEVSRMATASHIFNLLQESSFWKLRGKPDKQAEILLKIREKLSEDKHLRKQYDIIVDVVAVLDGRMGDVNLNNEYIRLKNLEVNGKKLTDKQIDERQLQAIEKHFSEKGYHPNIFEAYKATRTLFNTIVDYGQETFWTTIGPAEISSYSYKGKKYKSWQFEMLKQLRKTLIDSGEYTNKEIEQTIKDTKIKPVVKRKHYYPHVFNGTDLEGGAQFSLLQNQERMSADEMSESIKELAYWKTRTREFKDVDHNLFAVLTRRASAEANTRWTNKFRKVYMQLATSINTGMKIQNPDDPQYYQNIATLKTLAEVSKSMYQDVTTSSLYSFWGSAFGIFKGIYLTNLLLLSFRANIRNASQGEIPNFIEFGGKQMTIGKEFLDKKGAKVIVNGKEVDIMGDLGIEHADLFAKTEGAQEWDTYKLLNRIVELNVANAKGKSATMKAYLKDYMRRAESKMHELTTLAASSNIILLILSVGRSVGVGVGSFFRAKGKKVPLPEVLTAQNKFGSYRNIELRNRRLTAAVAFIQKWNQMKANGAKPNQRTYQHALDHARNMIDKTQFNYNMWNRPIALRGKTGALFQFKSFTLATLKLHWSWLKDISKHPIREWRKVIWFSIFSFLAGTGHSILGLSLWRFFEFPEWEYLSNYYALFFGDRNDRWRAWYGSRTAGLTGPIGDMAFEAAIALGLFGFTEGTIVDEYIEPGKKRREEGFEKFMEGHVPALKQLNEIHKHLFNTIQGNVDFRNAIFDYLGFYKVYYENEEKRKRDRSRGTGRKKKTKSEGFFREWINF